MPRDELAAAFSQGRSSTAVNSRVTFSLAASVGPSLWSLCYRHNYRQQIISDAFVPQWEFYAGVQLAVIHVDDAAPALAPAVSACAGHTVTIIGAGFSRLPASSSGTFCSFAGAGTVVASISNDTIIECTTPVPAASIGSQVRSLLGCALMLVLASKLVVSQQARSVV